MQKVCELFEIILFLKALGPANTNMLFAKFSKPKLLQEKLKLCKFPLKASVQKSTQNYFAEIVPVKLFALKQHQILDALMSSFYSPVLMVSLHGVLP